MTSAPLQGIVILDFSRTLAGPFAAMLLADLGATVIKIEGPGLRTEDTTRSAPPLFDGFSPSYISLNRSKYSLALDLSAPGAQEIVDKLAARAHAVVENLRWENAQRYGITAERFQAISKSIVFCRVSGYGGGDARSAAAYDLTIQAATGALDITGEAGRPPAKMGVPVVDIQTGVAAAIALVAGLAKSAQTGDGSDIDLAMFDVALTMLGYMATSYLNLEMIPTRLGSGHPTLYPYNAFATSDDYIVVACFTQRFWRSFCKVIGREDLAQHPDYIDFASRLKNRAELAPILNAEMLKRTARDWLARLLAGDVPAGPVNTVRDTLEAEQTQIRQMTPSVAVPSMGQIRILGSPFKISDRAGGEFAVAYEPPPRLGEHSRAVLTTVAGLTDAEVDELVASGVVAVSDGTGSDSGAEERLKTALLDSVHEAAAGTAEPPDSPDPRPPLAGVRILDFTRMAAGPFATMLMADLGADVVKVEAPRIGDPTRRNLPILGEQSVYFLSLNRGKSSIVVDLKTAEGRTRALELAASADVVIENFRPHVMKGLGLGYEVLAARNARLVMCSMSGFGATGPMQEYTSFDLVNQAYAGFMAVTGEEGRPPVRIGWPVGDLGGGAIACVAIIAALIKARKTGEGSLIDLSLHDVLISQLVYLGQTYLLTGEEPRRVGSGHVNIAPYRAYQLSDGYMAIAAYTEDGWERFTKAINLHSLAADARFRTRVERRQNRLLLDSLLSEILLEYSVADLSERLSSAGVAYSKVLNVGEALEVARSNGRGLVVQRPSGGGTASEVLGSPFVFDGVRLVSDRGAPLLGEQDEAVSWRDRLPGQQIRST